MPRQVSIQMWIVWLLASLFYAYQYIVRVLPGTLMSDTMTKFQIGTDEYGLYSGFYYLGYAVMHIPIGITLDRIGAKIVLPLSILLIVAGLLPLVYSDIWTFPLLGRVLIGIGSSGAILGVFKIIRLSFGDAKFNRMLGISVTIGLIGAIWGGGPVQLLYNVVGLENVVLLISGLGVALAFGIFIATPKHQVNPAMGDASIWIDIKSVLSNKKVLAICCLGGMMVGPLEGFADVWGKEYLKTVNHFDDTTAAFLPPFIFFGMCFGAPFLTYLADKYRTYYSTVIIGAFVMGISFVLLLAFPMGKYSLMLMFSLVGVMCAYQILVIYLASTYVNETVIGLTTACANMIIMIFGHFFHTVIGKTMDYFWDGTIVNGARIYTPDAFITALSVIPIGLVLGGLGFTYLRLQEIRNSERHASYAR